MGNDDLILEFGAAPERVAIRADRIIAFFMRGNLTRIEYAWGDDRSHFIEVADPFWVCVNRWRRAIGAREEETSHERSESQ